MPVSVSPAGRSLWPVSGRKGKTMDQQQAAEVLRNLDLRTKRMEQILPDLPTRGEMREAIDASIQAAVAPLPTRDEMRAAIQAAVAPLATKRELSEAVAPLATREQLSDVRDELRRHMQVLAERMHDDVEITLEALGMSDAKNIRDHTETRERLRELIRTEAQHHVGGSRSLEDLRQQVRQSLKDNARDHAEILKKIEKVRAARAAKLEGKPRKGKAS